MKHLFVNIYGESKKFELMFNHIGIVTTQKHPGDDKEPKKPKRRYA